MNSFARMVRLHQELQGRRTPISGRDLQERLGCSRATFHRALSRLKDDLGAPILNVPSRGYFYDRSQPRFELPGFWLTAEEIQALLVIDDILEQIAPGLLRDHVRPLRAHIETILKKAGRATITSRAVREKIMVKADHARCVSPRSFIAIASATLEEQRVRIRYHARYRNHEGVRVISPARLIFYRNNWYVEAYCHSAEAMRLFALDRVLETEVLDLRAMRRSESPAAGEAYGIFTKPPRHRARLRFSAERARWVADERWHPDQHGQFATDGTYELIVPYGDPRELIGEILRHGSHVTVEGPGSLRKQVAGEVCRLAATYGS